MVFIEDDKHFIKNLYLIKKLWTTDTPDRVFLERKKNVWIGQTLGGSCIKRNDK